LPPVQQQNKLALVLDAIETVIQGKRDIIKQALVALFAGGHLLVEDVPGVGKTTLAHALALTLDCRFQRIQFTSDLLPSDIIGVSIYNQVLQQFEFRQGPVFANVILADEINRTTPKTQSALLEAMSEGQITVDNRTFELPKPFLVLATQNPLEHHGTYPLPESQLDRFLMRIRIGYPSFQDEKRIFRAHACNQPLDGLEAILTAEEVLSAQRAVRETKVDEAIVEYALRIVGRTRDGEQFSLGVSPRGSLALLRAAQAVAFMEGRTYCLPDDVKTMVGPILAHRVVLSQKAIPKLPGDRAAEWLLQEIVDSTRVPL
jgi:MoxR-like ATPase